jgi:hypothetical protein
MGSQPKLVQDLVNGWPMIKANPATFIAIVVAIAFVEWVDIPPRLRLYR